MDYLVQLLPSIHVPELIVALVFSGCGLFMATLAIFKAGKVSKAYNKGVAIAVLVSALFYYIAFSV